MSHVAETHISTLLFAGQRVYKLLKPLDMGFLDHTTVERRLAAVTAEYELNQRLAPDVYLGTGDLHEDGEVSDRVLVMRRLPAERCLSGLVDDQAFTQYLWQLAHRIASFHETVPVIDTPTQMTTSAGLLRLWNDSADEIEASVGTVIDRDEFDRVRDLCTAYLEHSEALFDDRRENRMVRDAHGDLTADDIYMMDDGPRILDCLAFDDDLRISDVLADIGFLVMDIERLAGTESAWQLMEWYCQFSGENHPTSLAHHYVAYRAHVRAKVALLRHRQGDDEAGAFAAGYHRQALEHLEWAHRRLVLIGGGPGTGKTTVANALAERLHWSVLDSDTLRKDLRGIDHDDHAVEQHPDLYDDTTTRATYEALADRAGLLLAAGESVVIDATWTDAVHRDLAREMAERHGATVIEFECTLDPAVAGERIAARDGRRDASDATPDLVASMAERRDPWPSAHGLTTDRPTETVVDEARDVIVERSSTVTLGAVAPGQDSSGAAIVGAVR